MMLLLLTNALYGEEAVDFLNRILNETALEMGINTERLAGGRYRFPDGPANQALYELLESHIRQWEREITGAQDMIYYYQTAEGFLSQITEVLQRIRELPLNRGTPFFSELDLEIIDLQIYRQYEQIRYVLRSAEFNKKSIFSTLLENPILLNWFEREAYYQTENIDRLLTFILYQRSLYASKMYSLSSRIRGTSRQRENTAAIQNTVGDFRIGEELTTTRRNHLLLIVYLLQLHPSQ